MKKILFLLTLLLCFSVSAQNAKGAWKSSDGAKTMVLLLQDGYATATVFTADKFIATHGGPYEIKDGFLDVALEFDTANEKAEKEHVPFQIKNDTLILKNKIHFARLDSGEAPLAGVWHITGRKQNGELQNIHQSGTRKTLKLLTGTRFQWFAIDPDGNKFYGTGGGTYTFRDGVYTENIEFFSRDQSRVGASLGFKDELQNGAWHHTGMSSKGQPIYEIWEKVATVK